MLNTTDRRLKLLKMEGAGFSRIEILNELTKEFEVCKATIHRDYRLRSKWQPSIQSMDPEASLLKTINRYEQIYRKASLISLQDQNPNARVGALKVMLEATKALHSVIVPEGMQAIPVSDVSLSWLNRCEKCGDLIENELNNQPG